MTPLAEARLPTPTNKDRSLQPGKIAGSIRGDCGMPVHGLLCCGFPAHHSPLSASVFSLASLPVSFFLTASWGCGHVQTTTLIPRGLVCALCCGDSLSLPNRPKRNPQISFIFEWLSRKKICSIVVECFVPCNVGDNIIIICKKWRM